MSRKREGLSKRELAREQRKATALIREVIKNMPVPARTSMQDYAEIFAAVMDEVDFARKICVAVVHLAAGENRVA